MTDSYEQGCCCQRQRREDLVHSGEKCTSRGVLKSSEWAVVVLQIQLQAHVPTTRLGGDSNSSDTDQPPDSRHRSAFELPGRRGYDDPYEDGGPPCCLQFREKRRIAYSGVGGTP